MTDRTAKAQIETLARTLSAADVEINHGDYPTWDQLAESGEEQYRTMARYLLARFSISEPAAAPPTGRAAGWHLTTKTLDLFVRALVNEVDYDIHKGYECGEEDGLDHYPELVAEASKMLAAITGAQPDGSSR